MLRRLQELIMDVRMIRDDRRAFTGCYAFAVGEGQHGDVGKGTRRAALRIKGTKGARRIRDEQQPVRPAELRDAFMIRSGAALIGTHYSARAWAQAQGQAVGVQVQCACIHTGQYDGVAEKTECGERSSPGQRRSDDLRVAQIGGQCDGLYGGCRAGNAERVLLAEVLLQDLLQAEHVAATGDVVAVGDHLIKQALDLVAEVAHGSAVRIGEFAKAVAQLGLIDLPSLLIKDRLDV